MPTKRQYLAVPYFKQDTKYSCGPASLQMVLAYYGIRESEEQLIRELETTPEHGTPHQQMIDGLVNRGLYCYVNDDAGFDEIPHLLMKRTPVVVHWRELGVDDDHYSVVVGFDERHVYLHDPWHGERMPLSHRIFAERWTCSSAEGACENWLMAAAREPFRVGRQYLPAR